MTTGSQFRHKPRPKKVEEAIEKDEDADEEEEEETR